MGQDGLDKIAVSIREQQKMLKLGIIGMSKGNGHPYSWPAIINGGYNEKVMKESDFPIISDYLAANRRTLGIEGAKVTHIWTQERQISAHISKASLIDNVTDNIEDMIGNVDAVLLARDDPENHVTMAKPFLDADVPLFIDKPLAITRSDLEYFIEQHTKGKFFMSCSSTRYSCECKAVKQQLSSLGKIELVTAVGKKDWVKYGIHLLEAAFALLDDPQTVTVRHISKSGKNIVYIEFENGMVATIHLFLDIAGTFQISLFGQTQWKLIELNNWYAMFRSNMEEFIQSVQQNKLPLDFSKTVNIIRTLIAGKESLEQQGKTILLKGDI